jgi:two-component system sensor histidine kinase TctE
VNSSISRRLVFWLAVPLTLLALCGVLVHYFNSVAPQVISDDHRLKEAAAALTARLRIHDGAVTVDPTEADAPAPADTGVLYAVRDAGRHLLAGDARLAAAADDGGPNPVYSVSTVGRRSLRTLTSHIDTEHGVITITVAAAAKAAEPAARFGFMSTLLWDFVQLDITLVLVWVGIQLGLRPIRRLRDEIAERSPQDLRPVVESSVPREIAPLAATINRLFLMLRTSVQSQQQFIANTAHQLRTPLTGMQAQLDLLLNEPAAAPIRNRLATLQESVRQLAHSANQLLTLARADPAVNIASKSQAVDLQAIVSEVVAKFFDRALQLNIDLGVELAPAQILADPALIDDLLSNLVDNALKYTPAGGRVTVSAGVEGGRPVLTVEDNGPGIPAPERQRVRQRFYRVANSPGHGSGLGLAIVEEIAQLYGASVGIGSGAHNLGTNVTVQFPEISPAPHLK